MSVVVTYKRWPETFVLHKKYRVTEDKLPAQFIFGKNDVFDLLVLLERSSTKI